MPPRTLPIGRLATRGCRAPGRRWDEVLVGLVERGPMKSQARNANVASRARARPAGPSSRWPEEGRGGRLVARRERRWASSVLQGGAR